MFTGHYNEYNEYNSIKTKQKNNYAFLRTKLKFKKKLSILNILEVLSHLLFICEYISTVCIEYSI